MIEEDKDIGAFIATCDAPRCTYTQEFDTGIYDWRAMIEDMRDNGWVMRQNQDGEWTHWCPACVEKSEKKRGLS